MTTATTAVPDDAETPISTGVLKVDGVSELTAANSESFRKQICTALNGHTTIEIDLSRTRFMDCAGLGALISLRNFLRGRNGVIRLVEPTPEVRQLFDLVGAGQVFEIINPLPARDCTFVNHSAISPEELPPLSIPLARRARAARFACTKGTARKWLSHQSSLTGGAGSKRQAPAPQASLG